MIILLSILLAVSLYINFGYYRLTRRQQEGLKRSNELAAALIVDRLREDLLEAELEKKVTQWKGEQSL